MSNIVIKKRISLDFLGSEYKDDYLEFKAIAIKQFQGLLEELKDVDNKQSLEITTRILHEQFIGGRFQGQDVKSTDLDDFDIQTLVTCLEFLTGQRQDPKF